MRNKEYQSIDCGAGGNCFFHAISRGLEEYNIIRSYVELRKMVSDWFCDASNAELFRHVFGTTPNEIVPHLGHMAHHCPSKEGWAAYTRNWNWQDWGKYLSHDGRWAGGLEIRAMNLCFQLFDIPNTVNIWKKDIQFLCEDKLDSMTILLMLNNNHFTLLKQI